MDARSPVEKRGVSIGSGQYPGRSSRSDRDRKSLKTRSLIRHRGLVSRCRRRPAELGEVFHKVAIYWRALQALGGQVPCAGSDGAGAGTMARQVTVLARARGPGAAGQCRALGPGGGGQLHADWRHPPAGRNRLRCSTAGWGTAPWWLVVGSAAGDRGRASTSWSRRAWPADDAASRGWSRSAGGGSGRGWCSSPWRRT